MQSTFISYRGFAACLLFFISNPLIAAPLERDFDLHLSMQGSQHWRNDPQATEATTKQEYQLHIRLHSDGILYSDNLLNSNTQERLEIKQQYYARMGLLLMKARNGGKLPAPSGDITPPTPPPGSTTCHDQFECDKESIEMIAAQTALQTNSAADLDAFLAAPGGGGDTRYLYFFGYAGCPNRIHITYDVHVTGTRAYDRDRKKPVPYSLDRRAETDGNEEDRLTLCEKFVATIDTRTNTVFFENIFIPSPTGSSLRNVNGTMEKLEIPLPPNAEMMEWITERMRKTTDAGTEKLKLRLHTPLDGDATVLGMFDGELDLDVNWLFKPVPGSPPAPIPPALSSAPASAPAPAKH